MLYKFQNSHIGHCFLKCKWNLCLVFFFNRICGSFLWIEMIYVQMIHTCIILRTCFKNLANKSGWNETDRTSTVWLNPRRSFSHAGSNILDSVMVLLEGEVPLNPLEAIKRCILKSSEQFSSWIAIKLKKSDSRTFFFFYAGPWTVA